MARKPVAPANAFAALERLAERIGGFIASADDAPDASTAAEFAALALELFARQFELVEPYRDFCLRRGRTPATVRAWGEIPAVPAAAFAHAELAAFPIARAARTFRTSGTTRGGDGAPRGRHHFLTLDLYAAAAEASFRHWCLPDGARLPWLVLAPSSAEAPDSSLSWMIDHLAERLARGPVERFFDGGRLRAEALLARLDAAGRADEPVFLLGTAFAFVHFLDFLAEAGPKLRLAPESRLMETGGFKGRSRELAKGELYAALAARLGLPPTQIVNEYGMTELSSQFYDVTLSLARAGRSVRSPLPLGEGQGGGLLPAPEAAWKLAPPWTRVTLVEPRTLEPLADARPGATGLIRILDLANVWSVAALQTEDLGVARGAGFEVLGRAPGALARGCGRSADEALAGAGA